MLNLYFEKSLVNRIFARLILVFGLIASLNLAAEVPANVQTIFENNGCTGCHSGNSPSGSLSLSDALTAEQQLIDINAVCNPALKRVVAGDPANSVLYRKVSMQNPGCGAAMPLNAEMISQADLAILYDWIVAIGPAGDFGLIEMQAPTISVSEMETTLSITVTRNLGSTGQVTVDYSVAAIDMDNATGGEDFVLQSDSISFAEGQTSQTISVTLIDDDQFEGAEVFTVTLNQANGGAVLGSQTQTKVTIEDDEVLNEPGTFLFSAVSYSVSESDDVLQVTVLRTFGAAGIVTVDINSSDISANANSDYVALMQTLSFDEGVKSQTVNLSLINDTAEESRETFNLTLTNPTNGAVVGNPSQVTVVINDDDGTEVVEEENEEPGEEPPSTNQTEAEYSAAGSVFYLNFILIFWGLLHLIRTQR
ncbi:Calx-beta domain-containing protein [Aliikangiella maris]|uniref:Calx-beta domain-containing protein n=2 Tax=Aliikangiella maris TaxID=3162458 RepID=A0ABV3MKB7_9GAMM